MHKELELPYFYCTKKQDYFLQLIEQELVLYRRSQRSNWSEGKTIFSNCLYFQAAPDQKEVLHILAVNNNNDLYYLLADDDSVRKAQFIVTQSQTPILLAFSGAGHGYFCGSQDGRLIEAVFSAKHGWSERKIAISPEALSPAGLAMDRYGGIHLLLRDMERNSLIYQYRSQVQNARTEQLLLTSALQPEALFVLSLDINQAVHIAWHDPKNQIISYRKKIAGGWPHGGWQPEKSLQISFSPQLLNFFERERTLQLWGAEETGLLHICNTKDGYWQQGSYGLDTWHPMRVGTLGLSSVNLAATLPPESWCFTAETLRCGNNTENLGCDEQDNMLLIHARRLMEGKQLLESQLHKKEASLAQLRQMLERSQENHNKQRQSWDNHLSQLTGTAQMLTETLKSRDMELTLLKRQHEQLQNRLTNAETEKRKRQAEALFLQSKLSENQALIQVLQGKINEQEGALASGKSILERLSEVIHKKPSDKN